MNQNHLDDNLYDYVSKRMDENASIIAEEHLKDCAICRKEAEELMRTLKMLEQLQPPPLPSDFRETVMKEIHGFPLPAKPLAERLKNLIRASSIKWTLEGLAVAALILLTFTIFHESTPEKTTMLDRSPKEFKMTFAYVKNPIIVEAGDIEKALEQVKAIINAHQGTLLQIIQTEKGMKMTFTMKQEKEGRFFEGLKKIGMVKKEAEGYRDDKGNMVIILKKH